MIPVYNTGTATLAAGSATMTGQGTLWLGNVRPGDQVIGYGGGTAIVSTVDSNTQITLTRPWRGAAQAAAVYEIVYTSDDVFAQALGRQVLQKISGSALMGLTDAVAAPRKGIRFDATSAASLFDLTDAALTLLDDPDTATMLATLGAQAKSGNLDALAALGTSGLIARAGASTLTARAVVGTSGEIVVSNGNGISGDPTLSLSPGIAAAKAYRQGNVLGTVSQTGGTPTGALIESGGSAGNRYHRFASGLQICTRTYGAAGGTTTALGAIYTTGAISPGAYAAAFSEVPSVSCVGLTTGGNNWTLLTLDPSATSWGAWRIAGYENAGTAYTLYMIAAGRWF